MFGLGQKREKAPQQDPQQAAEAQQRLSIAQQCDAAIRRMADSALGLLHKKEAPKPEAQKQPTPQPQQDAHAQPPQAQPAQKAPATPTPSKSSSPTTATGDVAQAGGEHAQAQAREAAAEQPEAQTGDPTRAQLEGAASAAEARVMALAKTVGSTPPGEAKDAQSQLQVAYDGWRATVILLIKDGYADSAAVKSFARKTEQAALVQANMPTGTAGLQGSAYHDAAMKTVQAVNVADKGATAQGIVDGNPLIGAPSVFDGPSLASAKARGAGTTQATVGDDKNGKTTGEVRNDLFICFCPGVARTGSEFGAQEKQAMEMGIASVRAEIGNFRDPDENAVTIATAIGQGKALVNNPAAKVILVGYSQGNTNLYAFMRDKDGKFAGYRKDVIAIHDMHSAAGGSQLADLAFAIGEYLGSDAPPTPKHMELLEALYRGICDVSGIDKSKVAGIEGAMGNLREALIKTRHLIHNVEKTVAPVMQKLGLHGLGESQLGKKLFQLFLDGQALTNEFEAHGGEAGKLAARLLDPVWKAVTSSTVRGFLVDGPLNELLHTYIEGGLRSLTTDYANSLMSDPQLQKNLSGVMIINSIGAVPQSREQSLVPKSQRLGFAFFNEMGLESDYQVAVPNQKLEGKLPNAVDLPTEAIGHWGVAGVIVPGDHPATYFQDFSPPGLTKAALVTFHEMGVI